MSSRVIDDDKPSSWELPPELKDEAQTRYTPVSCKGYPHGHSLCPNRTGRNAQLPVAALHQVSFCRAGAETTIICMVLEKLAVAVSLGRNHYEWFL
jgi:hypothetical protein